MIVFSFGVPKSASTFAYQLLRRLYRAAGFAQPNLPEALRGHSHLNFMPNLQEERLLRALDHATDTRLIIKTHNPPSNELRKLLRSGEVIAYASYRDPKDIALALVDAGRREEEKGEHGAFAKFRTTEDAIDHLHDWVYVFSQWIFSGATPLLYEELCFHTTTVATEIAATIGLDHEEAIRIAQQVGSNRHRLEQWGTGVPHRHETEMDPTICDRFDQEFEYFYRCFPEVRGRR